jgi:serine O-acetyltransferase
MLGADLRQDLLRYPGSGVRRLAVALPRQGFWAVAVYRLGVAVRRVPGPLSLPVKAGYKVVKKLTEIATGIDLPAEARIGPGLYIGHFGQVVVSPHAVIGARCNLSQGVTIGLGGREAGRGAPVLEDEVYVGPGAKLLGPIRVGRGAAVGANAVVTTDVPAGTSVGGVPAKVISRRGSAGLIDIRETAAPALPTVTPEAAPVEGVTVRLLATRIGVPADKVLPMLVAALGAVGGGAL